MKIEWKQEGNIMAALHGGRVIGGIIRRTPSGVYFAEVYPAPDVIVSHRYPKSDVAAAKRWVKRWAEKSIPAWSPDGW